MTSEDLKKLFLGQTLFRLDAILAPRLVPILYVTGLAGLLLWAVTLLFARFGRSFGDGLWGLLEIFVFGLLWLIALRIICEVLLVFFKAHEAEVRAVGLSRSSASLLEEVRDAISDIADEDAAPPSRSAPSAVDAPAKSTRSRPKVKRTARRSPPAKPAPPRKDGA
ncbi:MAG TPA: DUF4282 domain-containing protein [Devosiaceae bacterium]|jgi:hypothetical protein|nr:DUF4282 domain-containing protein [Devosiaceae bacterium]